MDKSEVLSALCSAIKEGRDHNPTEHHWLFATDCFCSQEPEGWHYDFSAAFMKGLCEVITNYAREYGETF